MTRSTSIVRLKLRCAASWIQPLSRSKSVVYARSPASPTPTPHAARPFSTRRAGLRSNAVTVRRGMNLEL